MMEIYGKYYTIERIGRTSEGYSGDIGDTCRVMCNSVEMDLSRQFQYLFLDFYFVVFRYLNLY